MYSKNFSYELEIATKRSHSCGTAHQTRLIISYKALLPLKKDLRHVTKLLQISMYKVYAGQVIPVQHTIKSRKACEIRFPI